MGEAREVVTGMEKEVDRLKPLGRVKGERNGLNAALGAELNLSDIREKSELGGRSEGVDGRHEVK